MFSFKQRIVALAGLLAVTAASALPTPSQIFTAENQNPGGVVTADVLAARTSFLGAFTGTVSTFGFERPATIPNDIAPIVASFVGSASSTITATVSGNGTVLGNPESGRFNTTAGGAQYWRVQAGSASAFSIDFDRAISAFGFYGTDIGDRDGTLTMLLTRASDGVVEQLTVHNTTSNSGSLLFYGFADANSAYSKITFTTTGDGTDFFGFDDFVVADAGQIRIPVGGTTPEPGSLALVGCGLLASAWARKAKRAA